MRSFVTKLSLSRPPSSSAVGLLGVGLPRIRAALSLSLPSSASPSGMAVPCLLRRSRAPLA